MSRNRIRAVRLAAVISQKELAERAGISQQTLCNVELHHHEPSVLTLAKLARALNVSIENLS